VSPERQVEPPACSRLPLQETPGVENCQSEDEDGDVVREAVEGHFPERRFDVVSCGLSDAFGRHVVLFLEVGLKVVFALTRAGGGAVWRSGSRLE